MLKNEGGARRRQRGAICSKRQPGPLHTDYSPTTAAGSLAKQAAVRLETVIVRDDGAMRVLLWSAAGLVREALTLLLQLEGERASH